MQRTAGRALWCCSSLDKSRALAGKSRTPSPAGTTINSGVIQVGNGGTNGGVGNGAVTDNGELDFDRSDSVVFTNAISGSGIVAQIGSSTLSLLGGANDTYTERIPSTTQRHAGAELNSIPSAATSMSPAASSASRRPPQ